VLVVNLSVLALKFMTLNAMLHPAESKKSFIYMNRVESKFFCFLN